MLRSLSLSLLGFVLVLQQLLLSCGIKVFVINLLSIAWSYDTRSSLLSLFFCRLSFFSLLFLSMRLVTSYLLAIVFYLTLTVRFFMLLSLSSSWLSISLLMLSLLGLPWLLYIFIFLTSWVLALLSWFMLSRLFWLLVEELDLLTIMLLLLLLSYLLLLNVLLNFFLSFLTLKKSLADLSSQIKIYSIVLNKAWNSITTVVDLR